MRVALPLALCAAATATFAVPSVNMPPVVNITTPITFTLTQGSFTTQIQAVERAESAASFYDYQSASSHTGFEQPNESKLFLYRDTTTGLLSLFITHNIDLDSSGISTGNGSVTFDIAGVPPGAFVAQSDDPAFPGGRGELDITLDPEGEWNYIDNTDGGVIDALTTDDPWCITVTPLLFFNVTSWVYHYSSGTQIVLDMTLPVTICFEPPTDVDVLDVDEGNDASLSGSFDDPDSGDTHVATWDFGDGNVAGATYTPGSGFTHHDCDPVFHVYGDDGSFIAVLSVDDDFGGHGDDSLTVNVHNVAPTLTMSASYVTGVGIGLNIPAPSHDPGSDDAKFTWDFGDGSPIVTVQYFNDGSGADPFPSPDGTHPFDITDVQHHAWCEAGTYTMTVTVMDDDGATTVKTPTVTVLAFPSGDECNHDPACSAGPDLLAACGDVQLQGQATDEDGDSMTFSWSTDCTGVTFSPGNDVIDPFVHLPQDCDVTCAFSLVVADGKGGSCSDDTSVRLHDVDAPVIDVCPAFTIVECDGTGNVAEHQAWLDSLAAHDACGAVTITGTSTFTQACGVTQREDRTFVVTDACGNSVSCTSSFGTQDATRPTLTPGTIEACYQTASAAQAAARAATVVSDVCSEPVSITAFTTGSCNATVTIRGTDDCGNDATLTYSVMIDAVAPDLVGVPADESAPCDAVPAPASPSATDTCDPNPVLGFTESRTDGPCTDSYTLLRTWTATDACGNVRTASQQVAVSDTTGPAITGVPADATVECDAVPAPASASAADACDPAPSLEFEEIRTNGGCADRYTLLRRWTATDRCDNVTIAEQTLLVRDTTDPAITGVPADATVDCDAVPSPASPTASDNCDADPTLDFEESRADGPCTDTYTLTRTWTAEDDCFNTTVATQTILVQDVTAPTITGMPADTTVECDAVPLPASPGATDACDPAPVVTFLEVRKDGSCTDTYTLRRTWTATDRCSNASFATQTIEVQDTTAPTLTGVPADTIAECDSVPPPAIPGVSDNCDPGPALAFTEVRTDGPCPDTYTLTRTWTATDRCTNASSEQQEIQVRDTTAPALVGVPSDTSVECDVVPPPGSPGVSDNCDPSPRVDFAEVRIDGRCPGEYTLIRTWTATDRCTNTSSQTQVLDVQDTTPPVITRDLLPKSCLWPPNHKYVGFSKRDFNPEIRDACSAPITWLFAGCASDQPDDDIGDGHTDEDCVVAADGLSFMVRAERQGGEPGGRHYGVAIVATDGCGNTSDPEIIGTIYVPHDQNPRETCTRAPNRRTR